MPTEELIEACHRMGMPAMEGINAKYYPKLREMKMVPAIVGSHGFKKGPLNRDNHAMCIEKLREGIDMAAEFGSPSVITFTGMREEGITDEQADRNCVDCWKQVIGTRRRRRSILCLEHLNTRDDTHPMKGHPGYFGDDVDLCIDLIQQGRLAADEAAVRHLPRADHERRRDPPDRPVQGLHRPLPHGRRAGPRRDGRHAGDQLPADHAGDPRDRLHRLRRPGVHSHLARQIGALRHAVRLCDV